MIARLWWKEARRVWPIWALLAGLGMFWMASLRWYVNPEAGPRVALVGQAVFITFLYMFLIGAAAFAGERENRTLELLDALPVERWRVWLAKAVFAAATTTALGALLAVIAIVMDGPPPEEGRATVAFLLLCGFGWSLFWSALSGNAMLAAALGMGSLALTFIQLNWGTSNLLLALKPDALTPWHWLFAVALLPASAAILHLGGPPRRPWLDARGPSDRGPLETSELSVETQEPPAVWTSSASRLVWHSAREIWPIWWPTALMGVGIPLAWSWGVMPNDPFPWGPGALFVGLVLGANVFNAENRRQTQRFLAHHGARAGWVWLVKLAVGFVAASVVWLAMLTMLILMWNPDKSWWGPSDWPGLPFFLEFGIKAAGLAWGAFATGAWCGMVFRRGLTSTLVSPVLWVFVCVPSLVMVQTQMIRPTQLFWIPAAVLAVTWAWSGDWLLDRPGIGRWARLALYSTATAAGVLLAFIADRAWSAPRIDPAEHKRIFQFDRIAAPIPPEQNAARAYREVMADLEAPPLAGSVPDDGSTDDKDALATDPKILAWLDRNEPLLEKARGASTQPYCRLQDLRRITPLTASLEPLESFERLRDALLVSSRVQFARGDLKGAWRDLEALFRLGRQLSGLNDRRVRLLGRIFQTRALVSARQWAMDSRQTAETLKAAREGIRSAPPEPPLADQFRADALAVHNLLAIPREDLAQTLTWKGPGLTWVDGLVVDYSTSPWEMTRYRRVYDLLAASRLNLVARLPGRTEGSLPLDVALGVEDFLGDVRINEDSRSNLVSRVELQRLALSTPPLSARGVGRSTIFATRPTSTDVLHRRLWETTLGLRLWQTEHRGRLPSSLDKLDEADPEIAVFLIDPFAPPPTRFGYVSASPVFRSGVVDDMLLYSVGPDGKDEHALVHAGLRNVDDLMRTQKVDDIVVRVKNEVPPPE